MDWICIFITYAHLGTNNTRRIVRHIPTTPDIELAKFREFLSILHGWDSSCFAVIRGWENERLSGTMSSVALCRVALSGGLGQAMSVGHGDAADDGPDDAHEALVGPAEEEIF